MIGWFLCFNVDIYLFISGINFNGSFWKSFFDIGFDFLGFVLVMLFVSFGFYIIVELGGC